MGAVTGVLLDCLANFCPRLRATLDTVARPADPPLAAETGSLRGFVLEGAAGQEGGLMDATPSLSAIPVPCDGSDRAAPKAAPPPASAPGVAAYAGGADREARAQRCARSLLGQVSTSTREQVVAWRPGEETWAPAEERQTSDQQPSLAALIGGGAGDPIPTGCPASVDADRHRHDMG